MFGVELFGWQRHIFEIGTEIDDATGQPAYKVVGLQVGRQNGKTLAAAIRIGMELEQPGRHVGFTAQDRNFARLKWGEFSELLEAADGFPVKRVWRGSGQERVVMENGSTFRVFTPSDRGPRGLTLDLVLLDEALAHDFSILSAIQPTMATKPNSQMWLMSNAGNESSTLLAHYRQLGHTLIDEGGENSARLAWFEWCPTEDRFDPFDPDVWRQAIPTLGEELGVTLEAVEQAAASLPADVFAREMLDVWPSTRATAVIDPDRWEACASPIPMPPAGIVFGLDVAQDRDRAAIVACGQTRGRMCIEVVDAREGVGWVHDRLVALTRQHRAKVVIDGGTSAAGAFIATLEAEHVPVVTAKLRDYVNGCSLFFDAIEAGTLAHANELELNEAVQVAGKRNLSDAWAWQRRSDVDLTPLVAATLAHWAAVTVRATVPAIH
jgi:phage terminase large subunit-like protein